MGPLENERLVVDLTGVPAGPWLVGVVHQADTPVEYEIEVRFDEPLPRYRPKPLPPGGLSPLERAIRACVQVSTSAGVGSGSLLTPDGWILTNYHVVAECTVASATFGCEGAPLLDASGRPERVAIGLTDQERGVAIQYFLAELAHALPEYDLALLRIVSDVNGDPVGQLALPFVPIDVREGAVRAGEDVLVIGYPGIAQTSGRIPLAVTRGIVSGFIEERSRRVLILADAQINPGNSGGLMIRARDGVLIAVPSDVRYRHEGLQKQNYARPVTLLPPDWLEILEEHGAQIHR